MVEKYLLSGNTFEDPYHLPDVVLGMEANQKMNMILVIPELFDLQVVPLFNAFHSVTHRAHNGRSQQSLSILEWEYEVVMGVIRTVVTLRDWHTLQYSGI